MIVKGDKIREITRRNRGKSLDGIISEINVAMTGFINYFKLADMKEFLVELECRIRRKLRVIVWKHWREYVQNSESFSVWGSQ